MIRKQVEFPLLDRFKEVFPITHDTIFAYDDVIYTNNELPDDIIVHEKVHHKQQKKYGLDIWVDRYLNDNRFRLDMEIEAYNEQIKSIGNKKVRFHVRQECIDILCSDLYGGIISKYEAENRLCKK